MTPITAADLDPTVSYRVELTRFARVDAIRLCPLGEITLRGDLLARLIEREGDDVVRSARPC